MTIYLKVLYNEFTYRDKNPQVQALPFNKFHLYFAQSGNASGQEDGILVPLTVKTKGNKNNIYLDFSNLKDVNYEEISQIKTAINFYCARHDICVIDRCKGKPLLKIDIATCKNKDFVEATFTEDLMILTRADLKSFQADNTHEAITFPKGPVDPKDTSPKLVAPMQQSIKIGVDPKAEKQDLNDKQDGELVSPMYQALVKDEVVDPSYQLLGSDDNPQGPGGDIQ